MFFFPYCSGGDRRRKNPVHRKRIPCGGAFDWKHVLHKTMIVGGGGGDRPCILIWIIIDRTLQNTRRVTRERERSEIREQSRAEREREWTKKCLRTDTKRTYIEQYDVKKRALRFRSTRRVRWKRKLRDDPCCSRLTVLDRFSIIIIIIISNNNFIVRILYRPYTLRHGTHPKIQKK